MAPVYRPFEDSFCFGEANFSIKNTAKVSKITIDCGGSFTTDVPGLDLMIEMLTNAREALVSAKTGKTSSSRKHGKG